MYASMCMHVCVYVYVCIYVYVCMYVCIYVYVCVCMWAGTSGRVAYFVAKRYEKLLRRFSA